MACIMVWEFTEDNDKETVFKVGLKKGRVS